MDMYVHTCKVYINICYMNMAPNLSCALDIYRNRRVWDWKWKFTLQCLCYTMHQTKPIFTILIHIYYVHVYICGPIYKSGEKVYPETVSKYHMFFDTQTGRILSMDLDFKANSNILATPQH